MGEGLASLGRQEKEEGGKAGGIGDSFNAVFSASKAVAFFLTTAKVKL